MKKKKLIKKQQEEIDSLRKKYSNILNDLDIVINNPNSLLYAQVVIRWVFIHSLEKHLYQDQDNNTQSKPTGLINNIENENT